MTAYRLLFDHVLTRVDAETAHRLGFTTIRLRRFVSFQRDDRRRIGGVPVRTMGLEFPGVLGLAAGFDKNAVGIDALGALGFAFVEVGTVTGQAQPGNPRPRLFRLPADRAVLNRMGFNNDGAEVIAHRLAGRSAHPGGPIVGVNIGRSKAVPEDDDAAVTADYEKSARLLAPYAGYLVVNVSSPNTPGLRSLQTVDRLGPLLQAVRRTADSAAGRRVPLLVKIAPDLTDEQVVAIGGLALELQLDGIVATNTTISREGLATDPERLRRLGDGGISGAPLHDRALDVLHLLRRRVGPDLAIIAVGGVGSVEDARKRLAAGATLLQAYTAFIYEGLGWPGRLQRGLVACAGSPTGAGGAR